MSVQKGARAPAPVLIVDDERDFREGLQNLIADAGYEVHTASHGKDALEVLSVIPRPGLILLDLMMPVMNGHQLLQVLREDPAYRDIPVIVVSAAPVTVRGVMAFLKKPPDLDDLLAHVAHLCGGGPPLRGV